ncbi:hypothetical protein THRCLA_09207 [Thraustotheca clavata]|uniref:SUEL-type lectin domain-containing protein n=1 Tax=Thraustotheca clavata TaxID=74557 RepID=A0A1V9YZ13_9STRA|nr:hypothetical protein THRCLA_09207 [Thraustotheca clavata]
MKVLPSSSCLTFVISLLLFNGNQVQAQALGSIIGGSVQEGQTQQFTCPNGQVVGQILFASYGVPTGSLPHYSLGWCNAPSSVSVVESLCVGFNSCTVVANNGVFGDACYGTVKKLNVALQCIDENRIGGSISEGSMMRLRCPAHTNIGDIAFASFGTPTGTFLNYANGTCNDPTSATTVSSICLGKSTCDIDATTGVFEDPCPNEEKYLSVVAQCVDENIIQGTVNEGEILNLACPIGSSIAGIDFASFGTSVNYLQGSCQATNSMDIVSNTCIGHPACQVFASSAIFGDPCPGTDKSLSVQAVCTPSLPPNIIQASVNQGNSLFLSCPAGDSISTIAFASYGTPTNFDSPSWCNAPTSLPIVKLQCVGKEFCLIDANNGVFGDPCPGTDKMLKVEAQCTNANWIGGSATEGVALKLSCQPHQLIGSIEYASFGTPTGSFPNFVSSWCNAASSTNQTATACIGANNCTIIPSSSVYGDPCPGISKHLSVIANCIDADLTGGSASDGKSLTIKCPSQQYIASIPFASYGTPTGSFPKFKANPSCNAENTSEIVATKCVLQNSCVIGTDISEFGDPCPNTVKSLDITAKCVDNNIIGTLVAEGKNALLQCPPSAYIASIDFASYGTPRGSFPDFSINATCHNTNSIATITSQCYGNNLCSVFASDALFPDTCVGVNKSLAIVAKCISNDIIGGTAIEGTSLSLVCPSNEVVQSIEFASFGTSTGSVGSFATGACNDPNSLLVVQQACLGKRNCLLQADSNAFTDTCYGTQKHLSVQAKCALPPPIPEIVGGTVGEHQTLNMSCPSGQTIDAILFASYGVNNGTFPDYTKGWCSSVYSASVVNFLCVGQSECSINADNTVFSDSCFNTAKSLSVVAHCSTSLPHIITPPNTDPNIVTGDAMDGSTLNMQCPGDFVFGPILFASYGTSAVLFGENIASWCNSPLSTRAVQIACAGTNSCSIPVSPTQSYANGDPCPGVQKHFVAQMQCIDPSFIGGMAGDGDYLNLACPTGKVVGEILFASYGTPTGDLNFCVIFVHKSVGMQHSCQTFSDPCVENQKSLAVEAKCWPAPPAPVDQNMIGGAVDEHDTLTLQCQKPGYIIGEITFASYGVPNGTDPSNYSLGWCDAATSLPIVSMMCVGLSSCSISADNTIFGDPCMGTVKHLKAAAKCVPGNIMGGSVNEGSSIELVCPADLVISTFLFASYGTPTGTFPNFGYSWCDQDGVMEYVANQCWQQSNCSVLASSGVLGNPCPGILKSLTIEVVCDVPPSPVPTTPKPTPTPTPELTPAPTLAPTPEPTQEPTQEPTPTPTPTSTPEPTQEPTLEPAPTTTPTTTPAPTTLTPTPTTTEAPAETQEPTPEPASSTTESPTTSPAPTPKPTTLTPPPTQTPTDTPIVEPTPLPTTTPVHVPTSSTHDIIYVGGSMTEGSSLTLVCPSGRKLGSIVFASYGNPTGPLLDFERGTCEASTSMDVVANSCIGHPSCQLTASSSAFGDPCSGNFKALSVEAQCVGASDTLVGGSVDEHNALSLQCPTDQIITLVAFASYGQPTGALGTFSNSSCNAETSRSIVEQLCVGQSSCSVLAENGVFGDPCVNSVKKLSVAVECSDRYSLRARRRI